MLAVSKLKTRIFRNNVGTGWVGKMVRRGNVVIIEDARPLHAGLCEGSSDLIGWTEVEISPQMIGRTVAIFTAIEVKSASGNVKKTQLNFINRVKQSGGIAGIARNDSDAVELVKFYLKK